MPKGCGRGRMASRCHPHLGLENNKQNFVLYPHMHVELHLWKALKIVLHEFCVLCCVRHLAKRHRERHICPICSRSYHKMCLLRIHMYNQHKVEDPSLKVSVVAIHFRQVRCGVMGESIVSFLGGGLSGEEYGKM